MEKRYCKNYCTCCDFRNNNFEVVGMVAAPVGKIISSTRCDTIKKFKGYQQIMLLHDFR
jgi:hypothetical protein